MQKNDISDLSGFFWKSNSIMKNENSRINVTGKNFLFALIIALFITLGIVFIYLFMAVLVNLSGKNIEFAEITSILQRMFLPIFQIVGMCVAPITFLLAFALLQRFRSKN